MQQPAPSPLPSASSNDDASAGSSRVPKNRRKRKPRSGKRKLSPSEVRKRRRVKPRRSCRQRSPSPQSDLSYSDSSSSGSSDSGSSESDSSESDSSESDSLDIVDRQAYDADRLAQTSLARWTEEDVPALRLIDDIMDVDTFKSFIVTMIGRGEGDESEDEVELANLGSIRHDYFMKVCFDYRVTCQYKKRLEPTRTNSSIGTSFSGARRFAAYLHICGKRQLSRLLIPFGFISVFFEERMAMHGFSNELVAIGNMPNTVFQRVKQVAALVNGWQAYVNTLPMDIYRYALTTYGMRPVKAIVQEIRSLANAHQKKMRQRQQARNTEAGRVDRGEHMSLDDLSAQRTMVHDAFFALARQLDLVRASTPGDFNGPFDVREDFDQRVTRSQFRRLCGLAAMATYQGEWGGQRGHIVSNLSIAELSPSQM